MEKEKQLEILLGNGLKKPGAKPRRTNTRKQKLERIMRKEKY
jgi:hypothetical protein